MREKRTSVLLIASFMMLVLLPVSGVAQTSRSRLEGVVRDASSAIVPGATVTALDTRTNVSSTVTTNNEGIFVFPALLPGSYTVTAEMQGFRPEVHTSVVLNVSETTSESFKLEIGGVSEKVVVESEVQRINLNDNQIGRNVNTREISLLPQSGRSPIYFSLLQNGMQYNPGTTYLSGMNGLRLGSHNQTLDGIDSNDPNNPVMLQSPQSNNTDSVGEFRVVTSGAKAEYGRNAGGQIEIITRSGGSRWSGNAYDYIRNDAFNANSFFNNSSGQPVAKVIQNMFGASLGGPVIKDKTFIFGNYQGTRIPRQVTANRTVLTPEAKRGLFRWKNTTTGAVQSFDIVANDPRKLGIDPTTTSYLKGVPDPNNFDIGDGLNTGGYRWNAPANSSSNSFTIRADHNLTSKARVFYRHTWYNYSAIDYANGITAPFPGTEPGYQPSRTWSNAAGLDWTLSPRIIDEFRYGFARQYNGFERPRTGALVGFNSFTSPYLRSYSSSTNNRTRQVTNNVTYSIGKHIFKFGGQVRIVSMGTSADSVTSGQGIYQDTTLARANGNTPPGSIGPSTGIASSDRTTFENLYNDLLGRIDNVNQVYYSDLQKYQAAGTSRVRDFLTREHGYFFQDDWKVLPNLTVNLGLRWEFFGNPSEVGGFQGTLDQVSKINATSQIANLAAVKGRYYNSDWNNFAPRFGFAWSPDAKTSVRGGYGIFYDRLSGVNFSSADGATPGFYQLVRVNPNVTGATDVRLSDGIPATLAPASLSLQPGNSRASTIYLFEPNLRSQYAHNINLSIQRELLRNTVIDVGYVGVFGVKLFNWVDVNQARVTGDFLQAFQQLQAYRANGTAVPATNTLVKMFGSVNAAVTGVGGASTVDQGLLGTAADNVDRNNYSKYVAGGVSDFYLRNYPQFNQVLLGGNEGRSSYNSMQVTLRRQVGTLRTFINYTFSKAMDNGSSGYIDNYNLALNRARGNDLPHSANWAVTYTLPVGRTGVIARGLPDWADRLVSGWDLGVLGYWQSGSVMTASSGRYTYANTASTWANYTGDRNIGEVNRAGIGSGGIYYFTQAQINAFTFPTAGQVGTAGRNTFRGPGYNDFDVSLTKKFRVYETHALSIRTEAYNVFNHPCFANPSMSISSPQSFGRISGTQGGARYLQIALRYDF
jgi:hypothetical protein